MTGGDDPAVEENGVAAPTATAATAAASTPAAAAAAAEPHGTQGFADYYRVLREHRYFRLLWAAEMVDNIGGWLSYVATLTMVEDFSGGSGLAISAVVLIRFLPALVLAPICGVVADRCADRASLLEGVSLESG